MGGGAVGGPAANSDLLLRLCNFAAEVVVSVPKDGRSVVGSLQWGFDEPTCMLAGRLIFFALAGRVFGEVCWEVDGEGTAGREMFGGGCGAPEL